MGWGMIYVGLTIRRGFLASVLVTLLEKVRVILRFHWIFGQPTSTIEHHGGCENMATIKALVAPALVNLNYVDDVDLKEGRITVPFTVDFAAVAGTIDQSLPFPFNTLPGVRYDFDVSSISSPLTITAIKSLAFSMQFMNDGTPSPLGNLIIIVRDTGQQFVIGATGNVLNVAPIANGCVIGVLPIISKQPTKITFLKLNDADGQVRGIGQFNANNFELNPYAFGSNISYAAS